MKSFRIALLTAFAVLYAAQAHTQSVPNDPIIRTGGGHGSVAITSLIFRIVSPSGTSPVIPDVTGSTDCVLQQPGKTATTVPGCLFKNNITTPRGIGITITRLAFVIDNSNISGPLNCGTDTQLFGTGPFSMCSIQTGPDGTFSFVTFYNGSVPYGGDFSMGMRGFNLNTGFAGIALPTLGTSTTAEAYEFPYLGRPNSVVESSKTDAPRLLGCKACRAQSIPYSQRHPPYIKSDPITPGAAKELNSSVGSSSNGPNSDAMLVPSRIPFEQRPISRDLWRIT